MRGSYPITVKTIADKVSLEEIKPVPITLQAQKVLDLVGEAMEITKSDINSFLKKFNFKRDKAKEEIGLKKYVKELIKGLNNLMADRQIALNHFIAYGTKTTLILGAGERAGVISSYKSAFNKLPVTAEEWSDAIKIANGRWPSEISTSTQAKAAQEFKKVYKRAPNMKQTNDNAAVTVMAYGLRPANRNINSEKAAIKSFRAVYGSTPVSATDWDIVRAVAYSGARR